MTPVFVKRRVINPHSVIPLSLQSLGATFLKKKRLRQRTQKLGASKIMGAFLWKKKRLRQRTHKLGASKNMGAIFLRKEKAPAATYPQVRGFQKHGGHLSEKKSACGNVPTSWGLPNNLKNKNLQNTNPFCPKCRQGLD